MHMSFIEWNSVTLWHTIVSILILNIYIYKGSLIYIGVVEMICDDLVNSNLMKDNVSTITYITGLFLKTFYFWVHSKYITVYVYIYIGLLLGNAAMAVLALYA